MYTPLTLVALGAVSAAAQTYSLTNTYEGSNFFGQFEFYTGADPTNGFVDYVSYATAVSDGLISNADVAAWGVDNTTVLSATSSTGRASIRMSSTEVYNHGLFIADIAHMPSSTCGLWPAYWLLGGGTWPAEGEIDIIEGVNTATTNSITGHTSAGCTITNSGSGTTTTTDCDSSGSDNTGCSISDAADTSSYGTGFNNIGGGVYAVEWTSSGFSVWFFHRSAIPSTITSANPDPSEFGTAVATFSGSGCDFDEHFENMQIIFDTTFCGDWAGEVFSDAPYSCGSSCDAYVAENPSAYDDAYWSINYIKVYATGASAAASSTSTSAAKATSSTTKATTATTLATLTASSTAVTTPVTTTAATSSTTTSAAGPHHHTHGAKRHVVGTPIAAA